MCADMARYPQQMDGVVSLVDEATNTVRPNTNQQFVPVAQFIASKNEGGKGKASASNGSGSGGSTDAEDAGAMVS